MSDINFFSHHFIIDGRPPMFKGELSLVGSSPNFLCKETRYSIHCLPAEGDPGDRYFWLDAKYGKGIPWNPEVINEQTQKKEKNPRAPYQVETNRQIFCLYSERTKTLYASGRQCPTLLEAYLKDCVPHIDAVSIKRFFVDEKQFMDKITTVKYLKFVAKHTLFGDKLMSILDMHGEPADPSGYDTPDSMHMELKWKSGGSLKWLRHILKAKQKRMVDSMVCVGENDDAFEHVFNVSSFTKKLSVDVGKGKQGIYNPEEVRRELMKKVKDNETPS